MRSFRVAPMNVAAFAITIIFIGALVYFGARTAVALANGKSPDTFDLLATVLLGVTIVYTWLRSVKGYQVAANEVIIDRAGPGKMHISTDSIKSVQVQPDIGSFIRANPLSIQGLFGWAGSANVRKPTDLKSLQADVYGTNPANMIVLRLATGRTVIVTPNDPTGFADALSEAGVGGGPSLVAESAPRGQYKQGARRKRK